MSARFVELRRGTYRDSVRLMQVSRAVSGTPGVAVALVAMATELNLALAADLGFAAPEGASPNDLLVAIDAAEDAVPAALAALEAELDRPAGAGSTGAGTVTAPPRTVGSAVRRAGADLAVISTPGRYAVADAADALLAGASVVLFSDNVPVEQEVRLKDLAAERGLLLMGPDCGTAVVGGVGLGFANVVRPGPVGLVSASGTGAQQVMSLLDAAGTGISHCLGVGGRDLSAAVAGRSTLAAMAALDADPATELIVLISKPPAAAVAEAVRAYAATLATPVVFALLGAGRPDLTEVVEQALSALGLPALPTDPAFSGGPVLSAGPVLSGGLAFSGDPAQSGGRALSGGPAVLPADPDLPPAPAERDLPAVPVAAADRAGGARGALRGLFSGGTLCDEAMVIASTALGPIASNIPLRPEWALPADLRASGHAMIDFGDDALTQGRPHPMIDGSLRIERLAAEAKDPTCGVILLDVVLGHAAHPDPAAELAPAIAAAEVAVVVSLIGTAGDPQGLDRQATALRQAGAEVFRSNAAAARYAVHLLPDLLPDFGQVGPS